VSVSFISIGVLR